MNIVGADVRITMSQLGRQRHRVLREVERGRTFTITRYGSPVARLLPVDPGAPPI
jgi:prevent-host-death family protein